MTPLVVVCASRAYPALIDAVIADEQRCGRRVLAFPQGRNGMSPWQARIVWERLIDAADEVRIVAKPDGSLGESVQRELDYAISIGRPVRMVSPAVAEAPPPPADMISRASVVRLLELVADGREEYARGLDGTDNPALIEQRDALEMNAATFRSAARIVRGERYAVELLVHTARFTGELAELAAEIALPEGSGG